MHMIEFALEMLSCCASQYYSFPRSVSPHHQDEKELLVWIIFLIFLVNQRIHHLGIHHLRLSHQQWSELEATQMHMIEFALEMLSCCASQYYSFPRLIAPHHQDEKEMLVWIILNFCSIYTAANVNLRIEPLLTAANDLTRSRIIGLRRTYPESDAKCWSQLTIICYTCLA